MAWGEQLWFLAFVLLSQGAACLLSQAAKHLKTWRTCARMFAAMSQVRYQEGSSVIFFQDPAGVQIVEEGLGGGGSVS